MLFYSFILFLCFLISLAETPSWT